MSTRSRIGMEFTDDNGTRLVKSIYCHFDGYPEGVGQKLQNFFLDREKVDTLVSLGDISFLEKEIVSKGNHSFDQPERGVTVAYHRDRGEDYCAPRIDAGVDAFFESDFEEYGYVFSEEGEWLVGGVEDIAIPLPYAISLRE